MNKIFLMFGRVHKLACLHLTKLVVAGIAMGGVILLSQMAERKLIKIRDEQTSTLIEKHKRKYHYERMIYVASGLLHTSLLTLNVLLIENIGQGFDDEDSHTGTKKNKHLSQQTAETSFGLAVCMIICTSLIASTSYAGMMILGANCIDNDAKEESSPNKSKCRTIPPIVKARYLHIFKNSMKILFPSLISKIMSRVIDTGKLHIGDDKKFTLVEFESKLRETILSITTDKEQPQLDAYESEVFNILPWSKYLEPEEIKTVPDYDAQVRRMYLLVVEVLNTNEFNELMNTLVDIGLNFVLNRLIRHCREVDIGKEFIVASHQPEALQTGKEENVLPIPPLNAEVSNIVGKGLKNDLSFHKSCLTVRNTDAATLPMLDKVLNEVLVEESFKTKSTAINDTLFHNIIACGKLHSFAYNTYNIAFGS